MTQELQEALFKDFPKLFTAQTQPTSYPIALFGIECGDGWEPLLRKLCVELDTIGDIEVFQIKEKFGGLRFYVNYGMEGPISEEAHNAISDAESTSFTICEDCGAIGALHTDRSWIRTLCESCSAKDLKK